MHVIFSRSHFILNSSYVVEFFNAFIITSRSNSMFIITIFYIETSKKDAQSLAEHSHRFDAYVYAMNNEKIFFNVFY